SLATSRTARTLAPEKWRSAGIGGAALQHDQTCAGQSFECALARQGHVEVAPRHPGVLAGQRLGAGTLAKLDRLEDPVVLGLGDVQDAVRLGQLRLHLDERARRRER